MQIKKIDHINIVVQDLDKATKFFTDLLTFEVIREATLQGEWIDKVVGLTNAHAKFRALQIPNTETVLELIQYFSPQDESERTKSEAHHHGFRHMALEVREIEKLYQRLHDKGVKFFSEIQTFHHQGSTKKLCYFRGPEDIILELCQYD